MAASNPPATSGAAEPLPRAHRLVRRLVWVYGISTIAAAASLAFALLPRATLPTAWALGHETLSGAGGVVLAALLLAATGLFAALALTTARSRVAEPQGTASASARWWQVWRDPGIAARQGQAFIVTTGALGAAALTRLLWPAGEPAAQTAAADIAGALVTALAFTSLVAERLMNDFPAPQLPEAPALRRLLLLVTLLLAIAAGVEFGRGAALEWVRWPLWVVSAVPVLVAIELALRALARLFLPPPPAETAHAVGDSMLAGLLTGGPRSPQQLLRTHFGLDFARSWALSFLGAALLPAAAATALFCWGLSGLKLIEFGQRGIYERFGAPVSVLGPGLHLLLPWPLGRMRPVEYGTIHAVAIGVDATAAQPADSEAEVGAEAPPSPGLNRLWESTHADQANYLVASAGTGQQGFQSVSTEMRVLYRVGLTDDAALESVYAVADPDSLVRQAASRLVLRYFNSRTLDAVLGARRENIAGTLRDQLAADIGARHAGIEIVSFLIEEVHPPVEAAAAYHAVQAAEINASASISNEIGRAKRTAGVAQQEAHDLDAAATAQAAETLHTAGAAAYEFDSDRRAYEQSGRPFLLERSYGNLTAALSRAPLTILDHRISAADGPLIDLRPQTAPGIAPSPSPAPAGNSGGAQSLPPSP